MALVKRSRSIISAHLPTPSNGNKYILLATDRFSRRATIHLVSTSELSALGMAKILVDGNIPKSGFGKSLLTDNVVHSVLNAIKLNLATYPRSVSDWCVN